MTLEPDRRHMELLREACGLNAKARAITTPGDKRADNCDESLLSASVATSFRSSTMKLALVASGATADGRTARENELAP